MSSKRKKLSKAEFWRLNDGILEEIKKMDWTKYHYVHLFLPIKENNEVDTFEILSFFKNNYPQLKIVVPRTNFDDLSMEHVEFDHLHTVLRKNVYHIPEPVYGRTVPIELIDVILVPLLAFDTDGHRIGYGGGFYDRFLKNCKSQSLKIGLSLFGPEDKLFIAGLYDVKLTHCITPQKTFTF